MATFTELQCLNKLLLEKMCIMEQQHKKEMDDLKQSYYSLQDIATDDPSITKCDHCNLWFNEEDGHHEEGGGVFVDEAHGGNDYICFNCYESNPRFHECWYCEEVYKDNNFTHLVKDNFVDSCKHCYITQVCYPDILIPQYVVYNNVVEQLNQKFNPKPSLFNFA